MRLGNARRERARSAGKRRLTGSVARFSGSIGRRHDMFFAGQILKSENRDGLFRKKLGYWMAEKAADLSPGQTCAQWP
jgi:hypothetical protein